MHIYISIYKITFQISDSTFFSHFIKFKYINDLPGIDFSVPQQFEKF